MVLPSSYFQFCHIDNKWVVGWKHDIVRKVVCRKYFGTDDPLSAECREEAAFFLEGLARVFLQENGIRYVEKMQPYS